MVRMAAAWETASVRTPGAAQSADQARRPPAPDPHCAVPRRSALTAHRAGVPRVRPLPVWGLPTNRLRQHDLYPRPLRGSPA